ncbi:MAG: MBL fold metallo-hydrolase [Rhodospirillales bacterium]|nr:MBL fold metallo-hydrolase [Rhodospirillales bacterium]
MSPPDGPPPDRPAHHTAKGFRNPPGSPRKPGHFGLVLRYLWRTRHVDRRPPAPEGFVLSRSAVRAGLNRHAHRDSVTWLGHAAFLLRLGGRTVLTDPFLSDHASPVDGFGPRRFTPPALRADELPPIDALVLSHNHYDHLDTRALLALRDRASIKAIVPLGLGRAMHEMGFTDVVEVDWRHEVRVGDGSNAPLRVIAEPVVHFSGRGLFDANQSLWCGVVLKTPERSVFFGGDSALGPVFEEIGGRHAPIDLALLGIGAYEPRDLFAAAHATPEEAVRIGRMIGARRVLGMHYGAIVLSAEPPFEPPVRFRAAALSAGYADEDVWTPKVGETMPL